jgi:hypothetical protein
MNSNACSACRAPIIKPENSIGTGYATRADGSIICYACADAEQRAELLDRSRPYSAYVSNDAKHVTTWTGGDLGDIYGWAGHRTGFSGSTQYYFRVRDVHGGWWSARGAGKGMYCTLRPMKAPY